MSLPYIIPTVLAPIRDELAVRIYKYNISYTNIKHNVLCNETRITNQFNSESIKQILEQNMHPNQIAKSDNNYDKQTKH